MIEDVSNSAPGRQDHPRGRRYLAVWLPFLPTDRLAQRQPADGAARDERPLVVTEKVRSALRLAAVDPQAARLGLRRGEALADARARIPDLRAVEADPVADAAFLNRLAGACGRFTPLVSLDAPDGLVMDITGCAHLFGGEAALRRTALSRLSTLGLRVRATVAGTPEAARALARFSKAEVVPAGQEERHVRPLPVTALGMPAETGLALSRAGLKTLGCLADRSSTALVARFGQPLLTQLVRTLGREDVRITPLRPPPACLAERQFAEPATQAAALEDMLEALVAETAARMEEQGKGGRVFEAFFFRSDGEVFRVGVETARPTRSIASVLRLFHERLAALADPLDPGFGFDAIRLAVPVLEPLADVQHQLDSRAAEDEALSGLLDRLTARFGRDRVLGFEAVDTHDPDREMRLVPVAEKAPASSGRAGKGSGPGPSWRKPVPGEPPLRPLRLFDPPQPIETLAEVPDGPPLRFRWRRVLHTVAHAEGPERIAPEWWRAGPSVETRDYYRVEDSTGCRFWIFRRGLYGDSGRHPPWFLHGLFA